MILSLFFPLLTWVLSAFILLVLLFFMYTIPQGYVDKYMYYVSVYIYIKFIIHLPNIIIPFMDHCIVMVKGLVWLSEAMSHAV